MRNLLKIRFAATYLVSDCNRETIYALGTLYCVQEGADTDRLSMTSWKQSYLATRWMWLVTFMPRVLFHTSVNANSDFLLQLPKCYVYPCT